MRIEINEVTGLRSNVVSTNRVAEMSAYSGLFIALGAIVIGLSDNWTEITKNQKTATFSLIAIALFVSGLIASDTAESRRRFSSFLYIIAAVSSAIAVYVTFTDEPAPLQAFALATVVTFLGYTVSPTIIGHIGLYLATGSTLTSLGYQLVESENLRLYTEMSLVVAFAIGWLVLSAMRVVNVEVGFALGATTIFAASQYALWRGYNNLAYAVALGSAALIGWLYYLMRSWVLAVVALVAFGAAITEWVINAMNASMASLVAMFLCGALIALVSASVINPTSD